MKTETKVLIGSLLLGVGLWVADAAVDVLVFSKEPLLTELLIGISPYEFVQRLSVVAACGVLGAVSFLVMRREREVLSRLHENERRFQAFMHNLPGIAFLRDGEGRFLFVNRGWSEATGRSSEEVLGKEPGVLFSPKEAAELMEEDRQVLGGSTMSWSRFSRRFEGRDTHWLSTKFPIADEAGRPCGVGGISIDVTDMVAAERRLVEAEERYRTLFNGVNDGITLLDPEGRILEVNEVLCRRLQYAREELVGNGLAQINAPESADLIPGRMAAILEKGSAVFETTHIRRDGAAIPTEINARAVALGSGTGILSVARDVTERKAAERALREAEQLYRTLVDSLGEGVAIVDAEETFLFANPAAEAIFGVPPGGLDGRSLGDFLSEEEFEKSREGTRNRRLGVMSTLEQPIQRPDGTSRILMITATPMRDAEGEYVGTLGVFSDITDAKAAQEALRRSEQRYRTILEAMEEGYYEVDLAGTLTFVNAAFCGLLGRGQEEVLGSSYRAFMDAGQAERTYEVFHDVFLTGHPVRVADWEMIHRDGARVAIEASVSPIAGSEGLWSGFRGVVRDVTTRRRAETALRESEERYRDLVEHSVDVILTHDMVGKVLSCNRAGAEILGYGSPEEIIGRNLVECISPDVRSLFGLYLKEIASRGRARGYMKVLTRTGLVRILTYDNTLRSDTRQGLTVRARSQDVTEKLTMERALKLSERRYRQLFERNLAAVCSVTLDGRIEQCNASFARMFGFGSPEEALGTDMGDLYADPAHRRELTRMLREGGLVTNHELRLRRLDGTPFTALANGTLASDGPDGPSRVEGVLLDITARKRLDSEMSRARGLETVARLTEGVAHEVRNPLFAIQLNLAALARSVTLKPDEMAHMDHVLTHVKRLDELVRSLLEMGQAVEPDELVDLDLRDLARQACVAAEDGFGGIRGRIVMEEQPDPAPVRAASRKIVQALVHVLRNAAQASPEGAAITIRCFAQDGTCGVSISDEGPGIPDRVRTTLFDPFVTTRTGQPGLGLALAKHYVESHGGTITAADNNPPPGTTFTVRLPAASESAGES